MAKRIVKKPATQETKLKRISVVRFIYLYLIAAITFITFIIGAVGIVNTVMKNYVFNVDEDYYYYYYAQPLMMCEKYIMGRDNTYIENPNYQECIKAQQEAEIERTKKPISDDTARNLSIGIAQVLIAFPLWIFHWRIIERDRKEKNLTA
ncbi:hypothetical protein JW911_03550 [Candidatus Peregrinibacteria bacterium]|nr:hypothetical protein [Candidatus Peregrinibacteria bacterium]